MRFTPGCPQYVPGSGTFDDVKLIEGMKEPFVTPDETFRVDHDCQANIRLGKKAIGKGMGKGVPKSAITRKRISEARLRYCADRAIVKAMFENKERVDLMAGHLTKVETQQLHDLLDQKADNATIKEAMAAAGRPVTNQTIEAHRKKLNAVPTNNLGVAIKHIKTGLNPADGKFYTFDPRIKDVVLLALPMQEG